MAVRVTQQFKNDFETWRQFVIDHCEYTEAEVDGDPQAVRHDDESEMAFDVRRLGVRGIVRRDIQDGPDQFRVVGFEINDAADRYKLWADYMAERAAEILQMAGPAAGITERIVARNAAEREEKTK